jgi:hypothetical protein
MVFQLPQMTIPIDRATYPPMQYYDPARMVVHSRSLRWSWGAMIGRDHDWGRAVDALPLPERVRTLALAGFSGISIDRWGYTGVPRPRFEDLERELETILGSRALLSAGERYVFFDLQPWRKALEARLGAALVAHERERLLADMPIGPWIDGCEEREQPVGGGWSRSCGASARFELRNWRPGAIRVTLTAQLRANGAPRTLVVDGPGFEERLALDSAPRAYTREFDMGGVDWPVKLESPCSAVVRFRVETAPGEAGACSAACFSVGDFAYETRRLIAGIPVNADGGVAKRTKY